MLSELHSLSLTASVSVSSQEESKSSSEVLSELLSLSLAESVSNPNLKESLSLSLAESVSVLNKEESLSLSSDLELIDVRRGTDIDDAPEITNAVDSLMLLMLSPYCCSSLYIEPSSFAASKLLVVLDAAAMVCKL